MLQVGPLKWVDFPKHGSFFFLKKKNNNKISKNKNKKCIGALPQEQDPRGNRFMIKSSG
jgi:hypothetical protein